MKQLLLLLCLALPALAIDATLNIVKNVRNIPTIIVQVDGAASDKSIERIGKMLKADLHVSTHFAIADTDLVNASFNEAGLKGLKSQLYALVQAAPNPRGGLGARLILYDLNTARRVIDRNYNVSTKELYPFVAHRMAKAINKYVSAPSIDFIDRYVVMAIMHGKGKSDIVVSDYTLTYRKVILTGGLNIFPKWADANQTSIYVSKVMDEPTIYRYDIYNRTFEKIASSNGMAIVSDVSKDYNKLLLSLAPVSQADIFLLNLSNKSLKQLTTYSGIDVSGKFVDNDRAMVFVSNRMGYPNIYKKALRRDGSVEQMVFHGKNNSSVASYNNYIAYSSRESANEFGANTFNLYLISTRSDYIRQLSANGQNQMPSFSKDGNTLMFIKRLAGQSALGIIRINENKSYFFPLRGTQIQSFDW